MVKSNYSIARLHISFQRKLNFRANLSFTGGANDTLSTDLARYNRKLNFKSNILELSAIAEFYFAKPTTGNKFNLKDVGHKLAPNFLASFWIYVMGGVGGFFFNPKGRNLFDYNNQFSQNLDIDQGDKSWVSLHPLRTEGQGSVSNDSFNSITDIIENDINNDTFKIKTFKAGKSYSRLLSAFHLDLASKKHLIIIWG